MTANPFAALLDGVPRYTYLSDYGHLEQFMEEADVLAALSAHLDTALAEQAAAELQDVMLCRCHEAYKGRGLHDPDCQCDSQDALNTILAQNAALRAERDKTYAYAKHLAETIFANGKFDAPQWKPLEDTLGVLTQIDNMVAGIRARAALTTEERHDG